MSDFRRHALPTALSRPIVRLRAMHSDERGTVSILTVFTLLMFTMLLMMVFNIAKQHDDKVRMQNAADAAAYSGGVVLARGMNAIAFSNHLEAEIFAMTAILRADRERGAGLPQTLFLPSFERILGTSEPSDPRGDRRDRLIPLFQRDVVLMTPGLAHQAADEIALRLGLGQADLQSLSSQMAGPNGQRDYGAGARGPQSGVLWHVATGAPVADAGFDVNSRTLPVVDPDPASPLMDSLRFAGGGDYLLSARVRRRSRAEGCMELWLRQLDPNRQLAASAADHLNRLLEDEYPTTNVPLMLNASASPDHYSFVGVVYRRHVQPRFSRMFHNPLAVAADAITFAQIELYIPRPRNRCCPWYWEEPYVDANGVPQTRIIPNLDSSNEWSTFNQNWMVRLVPATSDAIPDILSANPGRLAPGSRALPRVDDRSWKLINTH